MSMNGAPRFPRDLGELKEEILDIYKKDGPSIITETLFQEWVAKRYEEGYKECTMNAKIKAGMDALDLWAQLGNDKRTIIGEYESWKVSAQQEGLESLVMEIDTKIVELNKPE